MSSPLLVIVDSSVTNLKILERLASSLADGTEARTFRSPAGALEFCRERRPDLVAVAGDTGEGEAAEFIARLQALPGCFDIPAVVIAPYEDRDCIDRALAAGAADHLLSPVDHHEFRTRIGNLLRYRRRPEPPADDGIRRPGLSEANERLLRVLDAVPAMVCATGADGRYLFVNQHFAEFIGRRAKQLVGRRPAEAHDDALARLIAEDDAKLLAGTIRPGVSEDEIAAPDGRHRVLLATKSLLRGGDGDEPMAVTVLHDITERKHAEHEQAHAKDQAELANRSKTEFLATMSHELRTPLNAIIGFSQVMAGEMLGPISTQKYVGYARDVLASAEHLLGIINDILDVSKLEAHRLELTEETIEVAKLVEDVLRLVEAKARASDIRIDLRSEGTIPRLIGDPRKIKQIVLNLLTNAVKFSHPGGDIEIVVRVKGGAIAIAVTDHGIGMDAQELAVASTRFGQVASSLSRRHAGTGLGLPLAIGLTELHGGTLTIDSVKGSGTTVTIAFPPDRSEAPPIAALAEIGGYGLRR
ncbi:MAG TPA: ATP-binding protein [Stellaceae bacterium]|nr:ATP-binding protein [Stellaceae bacterium]